MSAASYLKLIEIPKFSKDVSTMFESNMTETQRESRTFLLKIISCLRYLARQGLPFRGHGDDKDANYKQLIRFRAEDDPAFAKWLKEKNLNYTLPEIQNQILKDMNLSILRDVINCIKKLSFFVFAGWMKICFLTKILSVYTKWKRQMQQRWTFLS